MLLAQITDLHVKAGRRLAYNRVDTAAALEATVAHLNNLGDRPDAVLVTGDIADMGTLGEYQEVRPLLDRLAMPYYVIPGNHDTAAAMKIAFGDHSYIDHDIDHLSYAVDGYPLRLVGVDTTVSGAPYGMLPPDRLSWLAQALRAAPNVPTLIFLHHPPFKMGVMHMDVQNLLNADALFALLRDHSQVIHVAAGHMHRAVETVIGGIGYSIAPAPAHAVTLDFNPEGTPSYTLESPMVRLFRYTGDGLISHLSPIGTFDGPHPFFMADGSLID